MQPTTTTPRRSLGRIAFAGGAVAIVMGLAAAVATLGRALPRADVPITSGMPRPERAIVAAVTAAPTTPACAAPPCPRLHAASPEVSAPPTFDALDFIEWSGSVYSLPYDRIYGLSLNAPRTVCVIVGSTYQAVLEGRNLEPLYRQIQRHEIGTLKADSLADGATYSIPVVPLPSLIELSKVTAARLPTLQLLPEPVQREADSVSDAPVIRRVRVVNNVPFHYSPTGAYVSDGGGQ